MKIPNPYDTPDLFWSSIAAVGALGGVTVGWSTTDPWYLHALIGVAAVGGMALPAAVFYCINRAFRENFERVLRRPITPP